MVVKLHVVEGNSSLKDVSLRRPRTVVGRKKGCKLRIRSDLVSRIHCSLIVEGTRLRVKDLSSSNGTYVNGVRITEALLEAGDILQIGPIKFAVQVVTQPSAAEPTVAEFSDARSAEVVFIEADESEQDAEEVGDVDLLEELDDDVESATRGNPVVRPDENIFAAEILDEVDDAGYPLADSQSKNPKNQR